MNRHRRASELFLSCCEKTGEERAAFLNESCGEDRELLEQVEGMVAFEERRPEFLAASAVRGVLGTRDDKLPASIGPFRILRKLGQGGMGAVYEAQQESPHRTVALKVLQPFFNSSDALRRFEHEGEFLARLQHPGIAQIFDSGNAETEGGSLPYFALELVHGDPLTLYARKLHLSLSARLELLARVADAVQHAHQHGVIHRDLKPANILVEESGQPKVLDFGIARASDSDIQLATKQTDVGQILGTLAYMSPEQTLGDPAAIDTRSDVYSLGVLLYELIADRLPYDVSGKSLPEAVRIIQEQAPSRLSAIDSAHRGDLETIVLTALEKDKERRYVSAAALATDIRHYFRNEPIAARPPSRMYTLSLLVRRNRALAGSVGTGFLVLVAGLIVSQVFRVRAELLTDDLLRLSALQRLEDLMSEADRLWPPYPDLIEDYRAWIVRADALVSELPRHRAKRAELRALALPRTEEERRVEREAHPESARLAALGLEIEGRQRALARRQGEVVVSEPKAEGWSLVYADALAAQAKVLFAEGRDDEALDAAFMALELVDKGQRQLFDAQFSNLEKYIDLANSAEGLTGAREEIVSLENARLALDAVVDERRDWRFPDDLERQRWWNNQLTKLIDGLEALTDEAHGLLIEGAVSDEYGWSVSTRLALAHKFVAGGEYETRWKTTLPELALTYPGLDLGIQVGLVPLGLNADSGLWEFWHVLSGEEPSRDGNGRLRATEETGMVLVLLRGGKFHRGAQNQDATLPNYDADAMYYDGLVREVQVSPFFLSKYEMTQSQWARATGENPSRWTALTDSFWIDGAHPVESVSWYAAERTVTRLGLQLPSESEWEFGCRAGTQSPRSFAFEDFAFYANIADKTHASQFTATGWNELWDDGLGCHAPVGSLRPNGFGLYDTIGNVEEWCRDRFVPAVMVNSFWVDTAVAGVGFGSRAYRGGNWIATAVRATSASREGNPPTRAASHLGLRPSLTITN